MNGIRFNLSDLGKRNTKENLSLLSFQKTLREIKNINKTLFFNFQIKSDQGLVEYWGTSHFINILGGCRLIFFEPASNYTANIFTIWKPWIGFVIITVILFLWFRRRLISDLNQKLNQCLNYAIDTSGSKPNSSEVSNDEITWLHSSLCALESKITQKWLVNRLSLGLQTIVNKSESRLTYYLDEAYFFLRDLDDTFRVYYLDEYPNAPSGLVIKLPLNQIQRKFLFDNYRGKDNLFLHFPLRSEFDDDFKFIIEEHFTRIVEKSRLEVNRLKNLALKGDLNLAKKVQDILMPQGTLQVKGGWDLAFSKQASRDTTGEFVDIFEYEHFVYLYMVDLFDSDIKATLMAMVYKSFLDLKISEKTPPLVILNELHDFLYSKHYYEAPGNLFLGCIDTKTGNLNYVSAGIGMAFHICGNKYSKIERGDPPLCTILNPKFSSNSLVLNQNDVLYLLSAEAKVQSLDKQNKLELEELISIISQHETRTLEEIVSHIDKKIVSDTSFSNEGLRLLQLAVKRC